MWCVSRRANSLFIYFNWAYAISPTIKCQLLTADCQLLHKACLFQQKYSRHLVNLRPPTPPPRIHLPRDHKPILAPQSRCNTKHPLRLKIFLRRFHDLFVSIRSFNPYLCGIIFICPSLQILNFICQIFFCSLSR